jgi:hypothetical protein
MDFGEYDYFYLKLIDLVISAFCYIGYFFVFFIYWFFKELRSFSFELVIWLSISSCFYSLRGFLWPQTIYNDSGEYGIRCIIQSMVITFFENSTLLISCIIGYAAFVNTRNPKLFENNIRCYRIIFLSIALLIPLVPCLLIYFLKIYGPSDGWCWLDLSSSNKERITLINKFMIIYFCFIWLVVILNSFFFIIVIINLHKLKSEENSQFINRITSRLKWYPVIITILLIPSTVNRVLNLTLNMKLDILIYLQTIADSIQGLIFGLVYTLSPEVKQALAQMWKKSFRKDKTSMFNQSTNRSSQESLNFISEYETRKQSYNINSKSSEYVSI